MFDLKVTTALFLYSSLSARQVELTADTSLLQ
jgi:hypothetical protein